MKLRTGCGLQLVQVIAGMIYGMSHDADAALVWKYLL